MKGTPSRLVDSLATVVWLGLLAIPFLASAACFFSGHWILGFLALGLFPVWGFFVALPLINLMFRPKGAYRRLRWR